MIHVEHLQSFFGIKLTFLPNSSSTDLRFSMALCGEEKDFREQRKHRIMQHLNNFLGSDKANHLTTTREVSFLREQSVGRHTSLVLTRCRCKRSGF